MAFIVFILDSAALDLITKIYVILGEKYMLNTTTEMQLPKSSLWESLKITISSFFNNTVTKLQGGGERKNE